uniref:MTA n=1 Tax=Panagrolaimus sp. JU765 TaxID=591449 RepID=A0AC34QLQ8_9BILA
MYRVGDYVYFEDSPNQPYQIRRIDELQKGSNGNVEARVVCFYRRRDIPERLLRIVDEADRAAMKKKPTLIPKKEESGTNGDSNKSENGIENDDSEAMEVDAPIKEEIEEGKVDIKEEHPELTHFGGLPTGAEKLPPEKIHLLRQRELFMSRQMETLSATNIRGKCSVVLLSEVETPEMYLDKEDSYFYSLVYDPTNETLLADKGHLEIGEKHQAVIPEPTPIVLKKLAAEERKRKGESNLEIADDEDEEPKKKVTPWEERSIGNVPILPDGRETLVYHPHHNLTEREIDQYLILARAVGTFARALEGTCTALEGTCTSKLPTLHVTAAAASRDVTLFHALAILYHSDYDLGKAVKYLVPPPSKQHYPLEADGTSGNTTVNLGGPLLCRDQLEEWSPAEAHIFVEALEKYNKDFHEIRSHCLGWKSVKDLVEYYYMYKTSGRYAESRSQKKQITNDGKLKQVYIPHYNKASPCQITGMSNGTDNVYSPVPCESCGNKESINWYHWGPSSLKLRVCHDCWNGWKRRGGLMKPHANERFAISESQIPDLASLQKQMTIINATGINRGTLQSSVFKTLAKIDPALLAKFSANPAMSSILSTPSKTAQAFYLHTNLVQKAARKFASKELFNPRKLSRNPFKEVNQRAVMDNLFNRDSAEIVKTIRQMGPNQRLPPSLLEYLATQAYRRQNGQTAIRR